MSGKEFIVEEQDLSAMGPRQRAAQQKKPSSTRRVISQEPEIVSKPSVEDMSIIPDVVVQNKTDTVLCKKHDELLSLYEQEIDSSFEEQKRHQEHSRIIQWKLIDLIGQARGENNEQESERLLSLFNRVVTNTSKEMERYQQHSRQIQLKLMDLISQ